MERVDAIMNGLSGLISGGLLTWFLGKIIGRKKDQIELALNYQEFYQKHIDSVNESHAKMEKKVENLTKRVNELIKQNNHKDEIIEGQNRTIARYEKACRTWELKIKEVTERLNEEMTRNDKK